MYSFNMYDWFANFRDFSKAWQMKLKFWHLILQKIVKISSGQKNQTSCQIYMKNFFLSLPITFIVLVNVIPYQIFIQNTQITVFKFFSTKFGALPILQECPPSMATKWLDDWKGSSLKIDCLERATFGYFLSKSKSSTHAPNMINMIMWSDYTTKALPHTYHQWLDKNTQYMFSFCQSEPNCWLCPWQFECFPDISPVTQYHTTGCNIFWIRDTHTGIASSCPLLGRRRLWSWTL